MSSRSQLQTGAAGQQAARSSTPFQHLALALVMAAAFAACGMHAAPPADLDLSSSKLTQQGLYRSTLRPAVDSLRINRLHSWTVQLTTPDGDALESATVRVDGGMPQHRHGLPTRPRVTRYLGNGEYMVEGMKFNMPGWWVLKVYVQAAAGADSATFNLVL